MIEIETPYPKPRQLKASWSIETAQDLRWIHAMRHSWKWSYLWNWKAAWRAYWINKFNQKMFDAMAEEIRKECDEAMLQVLREEAGR